MEDNQLTRAEEEDLGTEEEADTLKKVSAQTEARSQPTDSRVQECYRHDDMDTGQHFQLCLAV